jgi:hypothetical protein
MNYRRVRLVFKLVFEIQDLLLHSIVIGVVGINYWLLINDILKLFSLTYQKVKCMLRDIKDILNTLSLIRVEV